MAFRRLSKLARDYGPTAVIATSSVAYGAHYARKSIHNDSPNSARWPKTGDILIADTNLKVSPSGEAITRDGSEDDQTEEPDRGWSLPDKFGEIGSSMSSAWSSLGDRITDAVIPKWAQTLPSYVWKMQSQLEMTPGSLAEEICLEAEDPYINPEILWQARVRVGKTLCPDEIAFQHQRKGHTTRALAKYLDIPEHEIDPDDVPNIAMCGSGGGLRALVAGASSYLCAQEAGLFDCVTYTAGVSGSCWLQALYQSSLAGRNYSKLIDHLKHRIGVHIAFPPPALNLLTSAPTNKFLLSGFIEKFRSDPKADFGLVDIYGILLGARLLVPRGELGVQATDLKLSNQRHYIDNGSNPMPIYTAVRHEIPIEEIKATGGTEPSAETIHKAKQEAWFQWFEWSPYEFWCEEFEAGIPTWSLGRQWKNGISIPKESGCYQPELRLPQLLGIWGSAFCATLSHYYREVRPIVQGIKGFGGVDGLIEERNDDLIRVHPIDPATIPNFALGLEDQLPPTAPQTIFSSSHLQLMDAGMSNNLPIYPLLRPGRDVDIIIAFDASADIKQENWLSVADGFAKQRGINGWPIGMGWPRPEESSAEVASELEEAQAHTIRETAEKLAEAREESPSSTQESSAQSKKISELSYCTVWIGNKTTRAGSGSDPPSKRFTTASDEEWSLLAPEESGIAVIYFPLLPNEKVPLVEPDTTSFLSTWNFIYTKEEVQQVVELAKANFDAGKDQTKRCVRAIYERKKKAREEREHEAFNRKWAMRVKQAGNHFQ